VNSRSDSESWWQHHYYYSLFPSPKSSSKMRLRGGRKTHLVERSFSFPHRHFISYDAKCIIPLRFRRPLLRDTAHSAGETPIPCFIQSSWQVGDMKSHIYETPFDRHKLSGIDQKPGTANGYRLYQNYNYR